MRRLLWFAFLALAGCSATEEPQSVQGTYHLATIGGHSLPYVPLVSQLLGGTNGITGGTLVINGNGTMDEEVTYQRGAPFHTTASWALGGALLYITNPGAVAPSYSYQWDGDRVLVRNSGGEQWRWEKR